VFWTILLAALEIAWVLGLTIWLVLERRSPAATIAWIFALAFLPLIGIAVYWMFGPRRWQAKAAHLARARSTVEAWRSDDLAGAKPHVLARLPREHTQLFALGRSAGGAPPDVASELELYFDGRTCYDAIERAIADARHHVHVEMYIWEPGLVGKRLRDALVRRAKEGIEVRLLLDPFGSRRVGRRFLRPLRKAGAEIAWFNQIRIRRFRPSLINFRTHRKIVVVDGTVGFTGGMNVADYHTAEVVGDEAWRDTHLRLAGDAVRWLQLVFLEHWFFVTGRPLPGPEVVPATTTGGEHLVQILPSGPDNDRYPIHKLLFGAIGGARERVWITTAYFVPDESMLTALQSAALRGVDVRVLTPEHGDSFLTSAAAWTYFPELIPAGVRVFLYGPRMLHAKTVVVDDDLAIVGTANFENRSFRLNFEVAVLLHGRGTAGTLAERFEADLEHAHEVTFEECCARPFGRRLVENTARLFSPLL
jgi:cardiolipin synthase